MLRHFAALHYQRPSLPTNLPPTHLQRWSGSFTIVAPFLHGCGRASLTPYVPWFPRPWAPSTCLLRHHCALTVESRWATAEANLDHFASGEAKCDYCDLQICSPTRRRRRCPAAPSSSPLLRDAPRGARTWREPRRPPCATTAASGGANPRNPPGKRWHLYCNSQHRIHRTKLQPRPPVIWGCTM